MRDERMAAAIELAKQNVSSLPPALVDACMRWLDDADEDEAFANNDEWELEYYSDRWRHYTANTYANMQRANAEHSSAGPSYVSVVAPRVIDIV